MDSSVFRRAGVHFHRDRPGHGHVVKLPVRGVDHGDVHVRALGRNVHGRVHEEQDVAEAPIRPEEYRGKLASAIEAVLEREVAHSDHVGDYGHIICFQRSAVVLGKINAAARLGPEARVFQLVARSHDGREHVVHGEHS